MSTGGEAGGRCNGLGKHWCRKGTLAGSEKGKANIWKVEENHGYMSACMCGCGVGIGEEKKRSRDVCMIAWVCARCGI